MGKRGRGKAGRMRDKSRRQEGLEKGRKGKRRVKGGGRGEERSRGKSPMGENRGRGRRM